MNWKKIMAALLCGLIFCTAFAVAEDVKPTAVATPAPAPATIEPTATPVPALYGKIIGIDPGHQAKGNSEKEAVAPGSKEKDGYLISGKRSKERLQELMLRGDSK